MSPFVMTRIMPQHHNRSTTAVRYPRVEAGPPFVHERNFNSGPEHQGTSLKKGWKTQGSAQLAKREFTWVIAGN